MHQGTSVLVDDVACAGKEPDALAAFVALTVEVLVALVVWAFAPNEMAPVDPAALKAPNVTHATARVEVAFVRSVDFVGSGHCLVVMLWQQGWDSS